MRDNVVLAFFAAAPLALAALSYCFFRRLKRWESRVPRWLLLVAGNLLVFLLFSSCILASGEVYYRFFVDSTDSFTLLKTTGRWMERHFHTNLMGFRDSVPLYPLRIAEKKRRVTFLGDSFTAGHGVADVEDRFANRIRRQHPNLEVHVFARLGLDTAAERQVLLDMLNLGYQLDVAVLVYCLNDLSDITPEWRRVAPRIFSHGQQSVLVKQSYFLNTLYFRWKAWREPAVRNYYQFVRDAYDGRVWQHQAQRLEALRDDVLSRNGRLLVVTFPFLHALSPEYEYRDIHRRLNGFWQDLGVPHLDLYEVYRSRKAEEMVVNRYDAHPNEQAHALAAEAISRFLESNLTQE